MTQYRRSLIPGGTFFFTVALANRGTDLLIRHIGLLRDAVRSEKGDHPFTIVAWVVLPEHLDTIWILPLGDADYPTRWRQIEAGFSRRLPMTEYCSRSRRAKSERGIWMRRILGHTLRDGADLRRPIDYVHFNPVKHGWAGRAKDWPYSTFHRYVGSGGEWGGRDFRADDVGEPD